MTIFSPSELNIPGLIELGWHHSHFASRPMVCHYHRNNIEIIFMVRGNIIYHANKNNYNLKGGDIFITPANIPHNRMAGGICEFYWIQLHADNPSFLFLGSEWAADLRRPLKELETKIIRGVEFSRKYIAEMYTLLSSGSPDDKYRGISLLVNILHKIIRDRSQTQAPISADIHKAVDYINANLYDEIDLQSLADEANLSLPRLKQKFQEQIGMPPRMFINAQKVEAAKELLNGGMSITTVAFDMGFNSSSYFSTVFRKFTRISPSEFIKNKSKMGFEKTGSR